MKSNYYAVIMAGGVGTRFWPESREAFPKQFLCLYGNRTLIQQTVDRITKSIPIENVLIITNEKYINLVQEQLPDLPTANIFGEPMAKNTAPCVALAAQAIGQRNPDAVMCVLPADHVILDDETYMEVMDSAFQKAAHSNGIVTVGITPTSPETGYGYIHFNGKSAEDLGKHPVHPVFGFKEKPTLAVAEEFVASGDYLWNSGMFIWSVKTIQKAFESYQPEMFSLAANELQASQGIISQQQLVNFFTACPSISVDYAIMEKAEHIFVVPGSFGWNDVGSWSAVYDIAEKDEKGNVIKSSKAIVVSSENSYVSSVSEKLIAVVGMENTAVIETKDAILVCNLSKAQDVKKVVEQLKGEFAEFK